MGYQLILLFITFFFSLSFETFAQCTRDVEVVITSINFRNGCDFNEGNGLDAVLEIRDVFGGDVYLSEFENLNQVTGPIDSFKIDLNINPNSCGNQMLSFQLGQFPADQESQEYNVDIFDRDNIFPCSPYFGLFDDDLGRGVHTFNFMESNGTIDVGSCMSFNYDLISTVSGVVLNNELVTICRQDSIEINGEFYNINRREGRDTLLGQSLYGCDSVINVRLDFYPQSNYEVFAPSELCPGETSQIFIEGDFTDYEWQDGSTINPIEIDSGGLYNCLLTDVNGCTEFVTIEVENIIPVPVQIIGDSIFCAGSESQLSIDTSLFISYMWSDGTDDFSFFSNASGAYAITTVDNNNCTQSTEFSIEELPRDTVLTENLICDINQIGIVDSVGQIDGCEVIFLVENILAPDSICSQSIDNAQFYIPNVFTPSAFDENSIFKLFKSSGILVLEMRIYDRWGNEIYQDKTSDPEWNGYLKSTGLLADPGVYTAYFEIKFENGLNQVITKMFSLLN